MFDQSEEDRDLDSQVHKGQVTGHQSEDASTKEPEKASTAGTKSTEKKEEEKPTTSK